MTKANRSKRSKQEAAKEMMLPLLDFRQIPLSRGTRPDSLQELASAFKERSQLDCESERQLSQQLIACGVTREKQDECREALLKSLIGYSLTQALDVLIDSIINTLTLYGFQPSKRGGLSKLIALLDALRPDSPVEERTVRYWRGRRNISLTKKQKDEFIKALRQQNFPQNDIAELLGISRGAVQASIRRQA